MDVSSVVDAFGRLIRNKWRVKISHFIYCNQLNFFITMNTQFNQYNNQVLTIKQKKRNNQNLKSICGTFYIKFKIFMYIVNSVQHTTIFTDSCCVFARIELQNNQKKLIKLKKLLCSLHNTVQLFPGKTPVIENQLFYEIPN